MQSRKRAYIRASWTVKRAAALRDDVIVASRASETARRAQVEQEVDRQRFASSRQAAHARTIGKAQERHRREGRAHYSGY
jgi:hypothetical protein